MNKKHLVKPGRDYTVECYRFLFCMAVLGFHFFSKIESGLFRTGYLGVEFFFLLSGYGVFGFYRKYMAGSRLGDGLTQIGYYIGRRILQLYPLYLVSLLFMLIVKTGQEHWRLAEVISYLKKEWAELLWLQCGPLGDEVLISANWYVPAVFWGSVALLLLLLVTRRVGALLLCPLLGVGIYGYYMRLIHKIDVIYSYHALLRGLAGLSLGVFLAALLDFWEKRRMKQAAERSKAAPARGALSGAGYVLANGMLCGVIVYMNFGRRSNWDFFVIGVYFVSMLLLFSAHKKLPEKRSRLFARLSRLTYPIYILQMPVIEVVLMFMRR